MTSSDLSVSTPPVVGGECKCAKRSLIADAPVHSGLGVSSWEAETASTTPIGVLSHTETSPTAATETGPLEFRGLRIDTAVREVLVDSQAVELTRLEFDLLAYLAAAPRRVFSRSQLLTEVWHSSPDWQTSKTVTEHVRRVRLKIESDPCQPRWIRTVSGAGYRFEP